MHSIETFNYIPALYMEQFSKILASYVLPSHNKFQYKGDILIHRFNILIQRFDINQNIPGLKRNCCQVLKRFVEKDVKSNRQPRYPAFGT